MAKAKKLSWGTRTKELAELKPINRSNIVPVMQPIPDCPVCDRACSIEEDENGFYIGCYLDNCIRTRSVKYNEDVSHLIDVWAALKLAVEKSRVDVVI